MNPPYHTPALDSKQAGLLVDEGFLRQFGLEAVSDSVRERLLEIDEELYAPLRKRNDGFAFEQELVEYSHLAKRAVNRSLPFAVVDAWQYHAGYDALANYMDDYAIVYSTRLDPIVQVMSAWLADYQHRISRSLELLHQHPSKNPYEAVYESASPDPASPSVECQIKYAAQVVNNNRNQRANEYLLSSFSFGKNSNLLKFGFMRHGGVASNMLYAFDRAYAARMMTKILDMKFDRLPSFKVGVAGELVVNIEDLADDHLFDIVFRMLYNNSRLLKLHVFSQGRTLLTIDKRWLKKRMSSLRHQPGNLFSFRKKLIPMVKSSLDAELEAMQPDLVTT